MTQPGVGEGPSQRVQEVGFQRIVKPGIPLNEIKTEGESNERMRRYYEKHRGETSSWGTPRSEIGMRGKQLSMANTIGFMPRLNSITYKTTDGSASIDIPMVDFTDANGNQLLGQSGNPVGINAYAWLAGKYFPGQLGVDGKATVVRYVPAAFTQEDGEDVVTDYKHVEMTQEAATVLDQKIREKLGLA